MCRKLTYFAVLFLAFGLVTPGIGADPDPSLMGWWTFDGHTLDISGNDRHGTLHGDPQYVAGIFGDALEFQDNPDYVTIDGYKGVLGTSAFSIVAWVKTSNPANIEQIVHWGADAGGQRVEFRINSTRLRISHGSGNVQGNTDLIDGQWHHVAASVIENATASSGDVTFYVDGEDDTMESTDTDGWDIVANDTLDVTIGYRPTRGDRPFIGTIDEVQIYNKALTQEEVQQIMLSGGEPYPFAAGPDPIDGAMIEDTWVNLSWSPGAFAVSHDVYIGEKVNDVDNGAEGTFQGNQATTTLTLGFPGFAYPDGLVPGMTYYWRVDEVNETEPNSPWKGKVWSFSVPPRTAYFPDPADEAESVDLNANLSWTAGFGAKIHTVYFGENFNDVNNAAGGLSQGAATYDPGSLEMAKTYYWRVDEFDSIDTYKGNVWRFTTEGAVGNPNPAKGAVDVTQTPVLTWTPGVFADTHEVYFGTDPASLELKGSGNLGSESYNPGQLEWNTTYYWRIDEANNADANSPWTGPLWNFTTADFLTIDDFESYNDIDDSVEGSNRIYNAWVDGYDDPTNGSQAGHLDPPFYEETVVHSGNKSLPLYYDNAVGKSEATLTLTDKRDWTVNGVNTLTIWFRGSSDNAAENLYVALNGSARIDNDNPEAETIMSWTRWNIDLQAFTDQGVNLANVNSITLGLSSVTGGTGIMYFDDIRLYAPVP
ncbi:MAG: LamG domain-containing protein [Planctomycetota bacterium]|jgi:hypothetical protein